MFNYDTFWKNIQKIFQFYLLKMIFSIRTETKELLEEIFFSSSYMQLMEKDGLEKYVDFYEKHQYLLWFSF